MSPGSTRTAVSRMVTRGELIMTPAGKYRLNQRLRQRQRSQEQGRNEQRDHWDGSWRVAVITRPEHDPGQRHLRREGLRQLRLAEQREGVWLRPDNLDIDRAPELDQYCYWYRAIPDRDPKELASELWDLAEWSALARQLTDRVSASTPQLDTAAQQLAAGFVLSAAVLRHFHQDPLLPDEILPPDWPGTALRNAYIAFDERFRAHLRDWITSQ